MAPVLAEVNIRVLHVKERKYLRVFPFLYHCSNEIEQCGRPDSVRVQ